MEAWEGTGIPLLYTCGNSPAYQIGSWMVLVADLDIFKNRKLPSLCWEFNSVSFIIQPLAYSLCQDIQGKGRTTALN